MPDPSPSTLTVSNSNFLQLGRRSGGRPGDRGQFTPGGYLLTVIYTTLAGIEPTTWEKSSGVLRKKYGGPINEDCVPRRSSDKPRSQANTVYFVF